MSTLKNDDGLAASPRPAPGVSGDFVAGDHVDPRGLSYCLGCPFPWEHCSCPSSVVNVPGPEQVLNELQMLSSVEKQLHVEFAMHVEDMQDPEVRGYMAKEVRKMNKLRAVLEQKTENPSC